MFVETQAIPPQGEAVGLRLSARGAAAVEVTGLVWWTTDDSAQRHKRRGFGLRLLEEDEGWSAMLAKLRPEARLSDARRRLALRISRG
jgi:hypothetical protein